MLTAAQLSAIMPALPAARRDTFMPFLQEALHEFSIEPPARAAAFLAQLAHESGQLRFMEEIWGPTAAQKRYEPVTSLATTLGNVATGDGRRFKGRGPIQITGRANYRRYGALLAVDIEAEPQLAAKPELAFRIAGLFWSRNGLNELADEVSVEAFKRITKRINGGLNGLADRERFYAMACLTLNVSPPSAGARGRVRSRRRAAAPRFDRGAEAIARAARRGGR
jgi:putative chitinase